MHRRALLYEQTTNRFLDTLRSGPRPPYALAPETELAERYGVSRSTVRKVVLRLKTLGIVRVKRRKKTVVRKPAKKDYFPVRYDTPASRETAERFVLRKLTSRELPPEARFSELELANEAGCGRGAVREALIGISRFGLIEKPPRQQWRVITLDEARINELMQMRELLETFALRYMLRQRRDRDTWDRLRALLQEHKTYNRTRDGAAMFQEMDKRLHRAVLRSCENRYIDAFFTVCSFLIDYQLRPEELAPQRIDLAVRQHVRILNALLKHDEENALKRLATHMRTVRRFLLETIRLPG